MSYKGFKPFFDENSKILILGSFPSVKSRETDFYYGNPQNRFWRVGSRALRLLQGVNVLVQGLFPGAGLGQVVQAEH